MTRDTSSLSDLEVSSDQRERSIEKTPTAGPGVRGLASLAFAAAALALIWVIGAPQPLDDAFITLRYARSVAAGDGFVFNLGERVLGTTTPLFTLLLAVAHRLTSVDLVWLAYVFAMVAHLAVAAMLMVIGRRCRRPVLGIVTASLYTWAPLALFPVVGCMETPLFVLATLCCLSPTDSPSSDWRSCAAAAAVLLRPEGILTAAIYLVDAARRNRPAARRGAALIAAAVLPWVAFATWYFGSPVPQSLLAKWNYHVSIPRGVVLENFWYLLLSLPSAAPKIPLGSLTAQPFGTLIARALPLGGDVGTRRLAVVVLGLMSAVLVCGGAIALFRRNAQMSRLLLFATAYIAAYCVMSPAMFPWYLGPPLPVLLLAFVAGGAAMLRSLPGRLGERGFSAIVAIVLLGVAACQAVRAIGSFAPTPRVLAYRSAVEMLGPIAQKQSTRIAALEIGAIGYYARAAIVDYVGLVSPEVLRLGVEKSIEYFRPDFYIGYSGPLAMGQFTRLPAFYDNYEITARVPAAGPDPLLIYRRHLPREPG